MEKFKKTSESVVKLIEDSTSYIQCEHKKMFGYPCLFHNGNMFCGTFADRLFFRLDRDTHTRWKQVFNEIQDFEPMPGRKMKEYLEIPGEEKNREIIQDLVRESFEYVKRLKPENK
jgi:TfoX/Sxy family transcriptional regulator of competence genes